MYFMMITEVILSYRDNGLEGVWNFPRVPDNISLNSFDDTDDSELVDAESLLSTSLPDMNLFDPLKSDERGPQTPGLKTSSSWLFEAMDTCAGNVYFILLIICIDLVNEAFVVMIVW